MIPNRENTDALSALTNRPTLPSSRASECTHRRDRKCKRSPTPARKSAPARLPISRNIGARRDDEEKMVATTIAFSQQIRAPDTHRATSHGVITVASRGLGVTWEGVSSRSWLIAKMTSKPTSESFRAITVGEGDRFSHAIHSTVTVTHSAEHSRPELIMTCRVR